MEGTEGTQQPHLVLAHKSFLLSHPDVQHIEKVELCDDVFTSVKADDMAPLYETLVAKSVLPLDQSLLGSMRAKIQEELKKLDENEIDENFSGITEEIEKCKVAALEKKKGLEEAKEQVEKAAYAVLEMLNNRA